jgi:hypothetical protein
MKATTRNAIPAKNRLYPVRNQTTKAIIAAGRMNRIILAITIIITMPMMTSRNSKTKSVRLPNVGNGIPNKSMTFTVTISRESLFKHFQ